MLFPRLLRVSLTCPTICQYLSPAAEILECHPRTDACGSPQLLGRGAWRNWRIADRIGRVPPYVPTTTSGFRQPSRAGRSISVRPGWSGAFLTGLHEVVPKIERDHDEAVSFATRRKQMNRASATRLGPRL